MCCILVKTSPFFGGCCHTQHISGSKNTTMITSFLSVRHGCFITWYAKTKTTFSELCNKRCGLHRGKRILPLKRWIVPSFFPSLTLFRRLSYSPAVIAMNQRVLLLFCQSSRLNFSGQMASATVSFFHNHPCRMRVQCRSASHWYCSQCHALHCAVLCQEGHGSQSLWKVRGSLRWFQHKESCGEKALSLSLSALQSDKLSYAFETHKKRLPWLKP